jgi:predicted outer membrane repeat protein
MLELLEDRTVPSTFTVTNTLDDGSIGSLRWAVAQVNSDPNNTAAQPDTIQFDSTVFGSTPQTITLSGSELLLSNNVTINGPGAGHLALDGGHTATNAGSRIFEVGSTAIVTLAGLTIQNGYASGANGGGILVDSDSLGNNGTLTITDCAFSGNAATGDGGGIYSLGRLTLTGSTFSQNLAFDVGGAIFIASWGNGPSTVANSTFTDNVAGAAGATYNFASGSEGGGAILAGSDSLSVSNSIFSGNQAHGVEPGGGAIRLYTGSLVVSDSTFSGNSASFEGGAIAQDITQCFLTISNSTFSGNSATGLGGAIVMSDNFFNTPNGAIFSLVASNSTFTGNSADFGGAIYGQVTANLGQATLTNVTIAQNRSNILGDRGIAGGIWCNGFDRFVLSNSIVAGNLNGTGPGATPDDISAGLDSPSAYNRIGTGFSGLQNGVNGNQVGVTDPGLAPLGDYGGPTQTMALLSGSPAIGAGSPALAAAPPVVLPGNSVISQGNPLLTDQRGFGFLRTVNGSVDIGAYQTQPFLSSRDFLQTVISGTLPVDAAGNPTAVLSLDTQAQADAFMSVLSSSNTNPLTVPSSSATPIDIAVSLASGIQVNEAALSIPTGFRVSVNGGTWYGGSPALTLNSGSLTVTNATFQNATDAPTILIKSGSLTLRNDVVQESTGFTDAAISITGGMLDLGTATNPGGNTLNLNGTGEFVHSTTANLISARQRHLQGQRNGTWGFHPQLYLGRRRHRPGPSQPIRDLHHHRPARRRRHADRQRGLRGHHHQHRLGRRGFVRGNCGADHHGADGRQPCHPGPLRRRHYVLA